jgi:citrate synthase
MSTELKTLLGNQIPEKAAALKAFAKEHGNKSLGEVTIAQCLGGARGVKCMTWETSLLDSEEGIRFRGHTIPDLQEKMPGPTGGEPTPESLLWLLLSSEIPTNAQSSGLTADLHERAANLPDHVEAMIRAFPKGMHPMTQFSSAILAMQTNSQFAKAYGDGIAKDQYWDPTYEDILNCIACLPKIAALIYRVTYHDGVVPDIDPSLDYSANFARMLGYDSPEFDELMRMYLVIHSDHEGGNASAHATHLVGSTLSDPYLSLSGGMNALAGPLHGLANQEVLKWIQDLKAKFEGEGKPVNKETITEFAWDTLNAGRVIPGYGHAVLRKTDPRYMAQREFALKYMPDDELFEVVSTIYEVMPDILTEHGKTKNPYPNVDSHSGVLLWKYGFTECEYYTVLFGVSRAYGALAQLFWDRALSFPLERPKSVTPQWLMEYAKNN